MDVVDRGDWGQCILWLRRGCMELGTQGVAFLGFVSVMHHVESVSSIWCLKQSSTGTVQNGVVIELGYKHAL